MKACAAQREARIAYIAPTFQQARDIAWEPLKRDCRTAAISINESRLEIRLANVLGTESLISLRGWESIETLRGQLFDLIVLDEVASMRNFWRAWEEVVRPTLTDRRGETLFISTPKGFNHFYDLYNLQEKDTDFKSFHFSTYDNAFIPPDEIDKAKLQLTEDRFAQEYMADFRKMEGLVYKEFDREKHVVNPSDAKVAGPWKEVILGVDFGFTNPAAVIEICIDHSDLHYVRTEFYEPGHTDTEIADYIGALGANKVYPDPEAAGAIEQLKRKKVNVRPVVKGKDSIKNGIDKVRELFKADKLLISSSCENLIWELEMYAYAEKKPDHNEHEDPIKENDHACDALRYAIMMNTNAPGGRAYTHYAQGTQQQNPIGVQASGPNGMPDRPRTAYTHTPNLNRPG
jgi:PBSX family phage terminase large subunit